MLKINYATSIENEVNVNALFTAVSYEKCDMAIAITKDAIEKQNKTINSKDKTDLEKQVAQEKLDALNKDLAKFEEELANAKEVHDAVVDAISNAKNEHVQNDITAVRNVLRLTACGENSRFFPIAILNKVEVMQDLYDAFTATHNVDKCDDNGHLTYGKNEKDMYIAINSMVQKILKDAFSIPVVNEYTKKVNVKFKGTDLAYLHETFNMGLNGIATKNQKTGDYTWDGVELQTAIRRKENKKTGEVTYDGQKFMSNLAKVAMKYICK